MFRQLLNHSCWKIKCSSHLAVPSHMQHCWKLFKSSLKGPTTCFRETNSLAHFTSLGLTYFKRKPLVSCARYQDLLKEHSSLIANSSSFLSVTTWVFQFWFSLFTCLKTSIGHASSTCQQWKKIVLKQCEWYNGWWFTECIFQKSCFHNL
jgi:hypothetical protein